MQPQNLNQQNYSQFSTKQIPQMNTNYQKNYPNQTKPIKNQYVSTKQHHGSSENSPRFYFHRDLKEELISPQIVTKSIVKSIVMVPCINCEDMVAMDDIDKHSMTCTQVSQAVIAISESPQFYELIDFKINRLMEYLNTIVLHMKKKQTLQKITTQDDERKFKILYRSSQIAIELVEVNGFKQMDEEKLQLLGQELLILTEIYQGSLGVTLYLKRLQSLIVQKINVLQGNQKKIPPQIQQQFTKKVKKFNEGIQLRQDTLNSARPQSKNSQESIQTTTKIQLNTLIQQKKQEVNELRTKAHFYQTRTQDQYKIMNKAMNIDLAKFSPGKYETISPISSIKQPKILNFESLKSSDQKLDLNRVESFKKHNISSEQDIENLNYFPLTQRGQYQTDQPHDTQLISPLHRQQISSQLSISNNLDTFSPRKFESLLDLSQLKQNNSQFIIPQYFSSTEFNKNQQSIPPYFQDEFLNLPRQSLQRGNILKSKILPKFQQQQNFQTYQDLNNHTNSQKIGDGIQQQDPEMKSQFLTHLTSSKQGINDTHIEDLQQIKSQYGDHLQRIFYSLCLKQKILLSPDHPSQKIPVSVLFKEALLKNLDQTQWEAFIKTFLMKTSQYVVEDKDIQQKFGYGEKNYQQPLNRNQLQF